MKFNVETTMEIDLQALFDEMGDTERQSFIEANIDCAGTEELAEELYRRGCKVHNANGELYSYGEFHG